VLTSVPDGGAVAATVEADGKVVASATGRANLPFAIPVRVPPRARRH
jgi:hypothetical protein